MADSDIADEAVAAMEGTAGEEELPSSEASTLPPDEGEAEGAVAADDGSTDALTLRMTSMDWYEKQSSQLQRWVEDDADFVSEGAERTAATTALGQFLDLAQPEELTTTMYHWLKQPGVFELLLGFVVRLDTSLPGDTPASRPRDLDLVATKRSYSCMQLLAPYPPSHASYMISQLIRMKLGSLVSTILDVFDPRSNGNWFHFNRLICKLIKLDGQQVTDKIIAKLKEGRAAEYMCANLHQPLVLDFIYTLLDEPPQDMLMAGYPEMDRNISPAQRLEMCQLLAQAEFPQALAATLSRPGFDADNQEALATEISRFYTGSIAVHPLTDARHLTRLVKDLFTLCTTLDKPQSLRLRCTQALRAILVRCLDEWRESGDNLQESAKGSHALVAAQFREQLGLLCHTVKVAFTPHYVSQHSVPRVALSDHAVKHSFTATRLAYIELIHEILAACPDVETAQAALATVPPEGMLMWRKLVDLFLEYDQNNIFQALFYRLFMWLVKTGHEPTLKILFGKTSKKPGLLSRFIRHYTDAKQSGSHGYMLLIFNFLRLCQESQGAEGDSTVAGRDFVQAMLANHPLWIQLLPVLRQATKDTLGFRIQPADLDNLAPAMRFAFSAGDQDRPRLWYGPQTAVSVGEESEDEDPESIELGSQFSLHLGFKSRSRSDSASSSASSSAPAGSGAETPEPTTTSANEEGDSSSSSSAPASPARPNGSAAARKRAKKRKRRKKGGGGGGKQPAAGATLDPELSASADC